MSQITDDLVELEFSKLASLGLAPAPWDAEHPKIKFTFDPVYENDKKVKSWVYAWVLDTGSEKTLIYIGKAGGTLKKRLTEHEGGGRPAPTGGSSTGRKNAKKIKEIVEQGGKIEVWARKAETISLFGQTLSRVSLEEEALIQRFNQTQPLWNKA